MDRIMTSGKENLREKAEKIVAKKAKKTDSQLSEYELRKLIFELEVHKIELELQNEELERSFSETQDAINLYDFVPVGCYTLSRDGKIIRVNNNGLTILDKDIQSVINRNLSSFITNDAKPVFDQFLDRLFKNKTRESCEITLMGDTDKPVFLHLSGNLSENIEQCVIAAVDITERKQAEKALLLSETKYKTVIENTGTSILIIEEDSTISFANTRFLQRTGYSRSEIEGVKKWTEIVDKDDIEWMVSQHQLRRTVAGFETPTYEFKYRTKAGELRNALVNVQLLPGSLKSIASIIDITERKQAEEALAQTRQNYETFFNTIDDLLFVLDEQGNIIHSNKTVFNRLGYTEDELYGKSVLLVHPPERREEAGRIVTEMLEGKTEYCPVPLMTKYGIQIPVETRVSRGFWDGKPVIFGVTKDISQVRLSEEKYAKLFHNNHSACGLNEFETGNYIEVNDSFYTLFGFSHEEVIGKSAQDLGILTPEAATALINEVGGKDKVSNIEVSLKAKNGDIKHVLLSGENIYIQDKKYRYTIIDDITARKQVEESLRESEEKYKTLFENTGTAVLIVEEDNTINLLNDEFARLTGYTKTETEGIKKWIEFADKEDTGWMLEKYLLLRENPLNEIPVYEFRYRTKSGELRYALSHVKLMPGSRKSIASLIDITERKQAEIKLKESELRYKSLFETSPSGIIVFDEMGTILQANKAIAKTTLYTQNELTGSNLANLAMPGQAHCIAEDIQRMLAGEVLEHEIKAKRKDGTSCNLFVRETSIMLPKGNRGILSVSNDITERKQAEELLRANEERFRMLFENSFAGILMSNPDGNIMAANPEACRIFKRTEADICSIGRKGVANLNDPRLPLALDERSRTGHFHGELTFIRADGTIFPVEVISSVFPDSSGELNANIIFHDITDRKKAEEALQVSESKFRAIIENSSDAIGVHINGIWEMCNPAALRMFGFASAKELIGTSILSVIVPGERQRIRDFVRNRTEQEGAPPMVYVTRGLRTDGTEFDMDVTLSPFTLEDQLHILVIIRDITEKKRDDDLLRENETRFRNIADTAPVLIWMTGTDAMCSYVNKPWLDFTGRSLKEELGTGWASDIHKDDFQLCTDIFQDAFNTQSNYTMEYRLRRADGEYRWLLENGLPWYATDGTFLGYIGSCVDITEGKFATEKYKLSEAKFRDLFEANTDGITVFLLNEGGPPSAIIDLNENAAKMLGYSKQEMLRLNPERIEIQQTKENIEKRIKELKQNGHTTFETRLFHKDGHEIDVEVKVLVVKYMEHSVLMNISRDISERKKNEKQLQNYSHELSKQISEKDKFFSIIAHDLRGPIGGFMGLTERMSEGMKEMTLDELQNIARVMKNSSTNIYSLLGNLLEWSRMQRGLTTFEPVSLVLFPKIRDLITLTLDSANKKEITISNTIPEDLVVYADENMLASIIRNLVANSVKFTPNGGKISISAVAVSGKFVEISISDNGIGMNKDMIENLFNLDVNTSRKGTEGELSTGLGLMICKDFVAKHGGELKVVSEVSKGSTFSFTLPIAIKQI